MASRVIRKRHATSEVVRRRSIVPRPNVSIRDLGSGAFPAPNENVVVRAADMTINYGKSDELGGARLSNQSDRSKMRRRTVLLKELYEDAQKRIR